MDKIDNIKSSGLQAAIYWAVVGLPLFWGIWKTAIKLPALFQ
ncbi:MAG: hypothetical protein P4L99_04485 [Chthoniobacter sp.]|nr:hypothetical protein [Chthoniobacter sp.]